MSALEAHEPSAAALNRGRSAFEVMLTAFDSERVKIEASELLPRYNRMSLRLRCLARHDERPLFLTVRRTGSKIGAENFYTVPFFAEELPVGATADYELLSFDSFAVPFNGMLVEMCSPEDYLKRRVSPRHIERAKSFVALKNG
jgi:hypothetical protein